MSKFDTYFLMTTEDAVEYAKLKVPQMDWDAESMECKENWRWKPELMFLKLQMAGTIALLSSRQAV